MGRLHCTGVHGYRKMSHAWADKGSEELYFKKSFFFFFFRLKKIFHRSHIYEDQRIRMSENAGHWEREQETKIHFNK